VLSNKFSYVPGQQNSTTAELAQSVERTTLNRVVVGSIPTFGVSFRLKFLIYFFWFSTVVNYSLAYCRAYFASLVPRAEHVPDWGQ
jgi:MFS-type transporter involved in bile tolerance (Atg22 family)